MMGPEAEVKPTEEEKARLGMCSVSGCRSGFTSDQMFRIPDDPEIRLQWVEFLATANKQRFKESVWTDIRVCMDHFIADCFIKTTISNNTHLIVLLPRAVPSVFIKQEEEEEEEEHLQSIKTEPVENTDVPVKSEELKTCDSPIPCTEESKPVLQDKGCSVPKRPCDSTISVITVRDSLQAHNVNSDLIRQKLIRLKMGGKYVVNEKLLLQLLKWKCPVCDSKLKVEKVMYGVLLVLNQKCLQCNYRNQWKSQADAQVPTEGDAENTAEAVEIVQPDDSQSSVPEDPQTEDAADEENGKMEESGKTGAQDEESVSVSSTVQPDDNQSSVSEGPQMKDVVDEDSDQMEESGDNAAKVDEDSDEDWTPKHRKTSANKLPNKENSTRNEENDPPFEPAEEDSQLCTDCGKFFNRHRSHKCMSKPKPFSCPICWVGCSSRIALRIHSKTHDADYMHRCRYCNSTFKTRAYRLCHQRTHRKEEKPYRCPKCPERFNSRTERGVHYKEHLALKQLTCSHCGVEFSDPSRLQRHLFVHTHEKPFKCSVCDRRFNQASHLKSHMRLHTGERPFKCQHCDKCFNHNVSLKSHVQRYHSANSGGNPTNGNKTNQTLNKTMDAKDNKKERVAESGFDSVVEEQDQAKDAHRSRQSRRSGNPEESPETCEQQEQKLERKGTEGNGDESSVRCLNSKEKKKERSKKARNNTRPQKRAKISDSDSDYDPEDAKKKRYNKRGKK